MSQPRYTAVDPTPESIAALFEHLTGRKPTDDEMVEVRSELEVTKASKYREDQPRVPAGNEDGGQWTSTGGGGGGAAPAKPGETPPAEEDPTKDPTLQPFDFNEDARDEDGLLEPEIIEAASEPRSTGSEAVAGEFMSQDDHVNPVRILKAGEGRAIFKEEDLEKWEIEGSPVRMTLMSDATQAQRDELAYRVDRALGLGMTPRTERVMQTFTGQADPSEGDEPGPTEAVTAVGSSQQFVKHDPERQVRSRGADAFDNAPPREIAHLAVLDTIIGNTDRHAGNVLVTTDKSGKDHIIAIDNGLSFGVGQVNEPGAEWTGVRELRSFAPMLVAGRGVGETMTAAAQKKLAARIRAMPIDRLVKNTGMSKQEIAAFKSRAKTVADVLAKGEVHNLQGKVLAEPY